MLPLLASLALGADPVWVGTWEVDLSPAELDATHIAVVEGAARALPWWSRPFARPALRRAVWTCNSVGLEQGDAAVVVRCDEKAPLEVGYEAPVATIDSLGRPVEVSARRHGEDLELRFTSELGIRWALFEHRGDGRFVCARRVESDHLGEPLSWEVPYRRRQ